MSKVTINVNFFLKEPTKAVSRVFAVIYIQGGRIVVQTGVKTAPKFWNAEKHRTREQEKNEGYGMVNAMLDEWAELISSVVTGFEAKLYIPTPAEFRQALGERRRGKPAESQESQEPALPSLTDWVTEWVTTSDKKERTVKSYVTALNKLKVFEKCRGKKLQFSDINMDFYSEFKKWMTTKGFKKSKDAEVTHYRKNYFGTLVKAVKVFMEESKYMHGLDGHRSIKFAVVQERVTAIYLTEQELIKLHRLVIDEDAIKKHCPDIYKQRMNLRIKSLEDARDRFLIGAFTGLRFSDYGDISKIDTVGNRLEIYTIKTDTHVVIPLHWVIKEIVERRQGMLPKPVSNQKLNQQLKWLGRIAEFKEKVTISFTEGNRRVNKTVPKYDMLTTHTARRSAATNMYLAGIPTLAIMQITGHKTERAFLLYIGVTAEQNAATLAMHPFFTGMKSN